MIKSTLILAPIVLALTMAADSSDAAERKGFKNANSHGQAQARSSRRRDKNSNARAERLFNKLDTDDSGVVTLDEFLVKPIEKAAMQFSRIDSDDDELISLDEFLAIHHNRSKDLDIDIDALRACILENSDIAESDLPDTDRPDGTGRFLAIDTNGDGFIDLGEFEAAKTEKATNKFNRIDANDDGGITLEELIAAFEQHHERHAVRRACVEAQEDLDDLIEG